MSEPCPEPADEQRTTRSDQALVRQARTGSREAYEHLLVWCEPEVRRFIATRSGAKLRRYTSHSDVLQEVLLRGTDALRVLPDGATAGDFLNLLLQHAQWAIGKVVRRSRRFAGESALAPGGGPEATPTPSNPVGSVTKADEASWLTAQVSALEEPLAAAVSLRLHGLGFAEIARRLGIGEDAARKRLVRAALLLRERAERGSR